MYIYYTILLLRISEKIFEHLEECRLYLTIIVYCAHNCALDERDSACVFANVLITGRSEYVDRSQWRGGPVNCIQKQRSHLLRTGESSRGRGIIVAARNKRNFKRSSRGSPLSWEAAV